MTYGPAHNNLGLMHYEQGNYYQAVLAFEQAMDLMPQDPTVLNNLGLTLEAAGKIHEALDLYMQAAEMDPVNPNLPGQSGAIASSDGRSTIRRSLRNCKTWF